MADSQTTKGNQTRREHYNPRLLQRGFAVERKPGKFQTQVFDKTTGRSFSSAIENVAAERDFNTVDIGNYTVSWENKLTHVEDLAAPVIDRIRTEKSLAGLTDMDRGTLCVFAALQFIRGTDYRARWTHLGRMLQEKIGSIAGEPLAPTTPEAEDQEARLASMKALETSLNEYARHFATKDILLFEAAKGTGFLLGDSPIALTNVKTFGPYGNLGLAVTGIQINLPLSTELSLAFWCPSYFEEIAENVAKGKAAIRAASATAVFADPVAAAQRLEESRAALGRLLGMLNAKQAGRPLACTPDNVTNLNSLQVMYAERFVMSRDGGFSLVRGMLADNPAYVTGRRMTMG